MRQHSVPVSELAVDIECAKRSSRFKNKGMKAHTSATESELTAQLPDALWRLDANTTPLCATVSEEWQSFDWEDSDTESQAIAG